jgi:hypothetical protein
MLCHQRAEAARRARIELPLPTDVLPGGLLVGAGDLDEPGRRARAAAASAASAAPLALARHGRAGVEANPPPAQLPGGVSILNIS